MLADLLITKDGKPGPLDLKRREFITLLGGTQPGAPHHPVIIRIRTRSLRTK
jgi:hypothetical protein